MRMPIRAYHEQWRLELAFWEVDDGAVESTEDGSAKTNSLELRQRYYDEIPGKLGTLTSPKPHFKSTKQENAIQDF